MSTAPSNEIATRTPAMQLVARVREPAFREQVAMALPENVNVDRFLRVTATALLANPDIANQLDHNSILRALVQSASAGLIPDGREAAIVGRGGQAVWQPMITGFRKIAAEHGWTLKTKAVYANDEFEHVEEPEDIRHSYRPGERGEIIGAYAIATHKDGRRLVRFMTIEEIGKRRAQATTQNVWNKWPAEMAEKTVGRNLFADLPLADSDLERERIKRLLSEGELVSDAATALYGSQDRAALPAAETPVNDGRPATSAVGSTEHTGDRQQADAATQEPQTPPAAAAPAPGPAVQEEPDIGGDGGFNAPEAVAQDEAVLAAQHASQFTIPNGKHRGIALGELLDKDGGSTWLAWALSHISEPPEYVSALFAFSRVFAPDLFQAELARREAS